MDLETYPYIHRDISWLSFNYRVLQEAKDPSVPLMEKIKFLAIYSSNLNEFFRVRVANHRNLLRVGKKTKKKLEFEPKKILKEILKIVNEQQVEFSDIFENQIIPELKKQHIYLLRRTDLKKDQIEFVENYFKDNMLPFVQPVVLLQGKVRPFLNNAALYLALYMKDKETAKEEFAIVKIPSDHLERFVILPSKNHHHNLIMLDDIVRHNVQLLFPGYDIIDSFSIKLSRDAELYIDDEFSGDLIAKIKSSLGKRNVGPPSRFVYDREMPNVLSHFLEENFEIDKYDLIPEGRYHNNFDFFRFPDFGYKYLQNNPLPPIPYSPLEEAKDYFDAIKRKDHLIHVPYHSYESVIQFFERAADDPKVTHIKIIQYRVAKKSRIMNALIKAVKSGKQVSAFIEVKARFDEEQNLKWGERLEAAGIKVQYSFPGLKVHSKLALVRREEKTGGKLYAYLSTGNFNEDTAKVYSDLGLFTADERLVGESARLFSFLETVKLPEQQFEHLLVGQFNLRPQLEKFIEQEIKNAQNGKEASITLKMNSLEDDEMIQRLYIADQAGVKVNLIIRGICSLVPKNKGFSDNIDAISIVDRFLEHARIFIFHNDGSEKIYLSSADWMTRNLSYRIETAFPIYDKDLRTEIRDFIRIQNHDNTKARIIDEYSSNEYRKNNSDLAVRSQLETYYYIKRKMESIQIEAMEKMDLK